VTFAQFICSNSLALANQLWQLALATHFGNSLWQLALATRFGNSLWQLALATHFRNLLWQLASGTHFGNLLWELAWGTRFGKSLRELALASRFGNSLWKLTLASHFRNSLQELASGTCFGNSLQATRFGKLLRDLHSSALEHSKVSTLDTYNFLRYETFGAVWDICTHTPCPTRLYNYGITTMANDQGTTWRGEKNNQKNSQMEQNAGK
jgi:hypothetical protein